MENVIINFTIYTINDDLIRESIEYIMNILKDDLKYQLNEITYGKHRNAERHHTHIHTFSTFGSNAKIYKQLNEKIKRTQYFEEWKTEIKDKLSYKIHITFNYNVTLADRYSAMAYPLKEYKEDANIAQDLCHIEDYISKSKWSEYRQYANKLYEAKLKIEEREKQLKIKKQQESELLFEYLNGYIENGQGEHLDTEEMKSLVRETVRHMIHHYRKEGKRFNCNMLKNIAVNYLYIRQRIHEYNIVEYLKI